jgi:hypothetical protein
LPPTQTKVGRPLNTDIWQDVELDGFGVEDSAAVPVAWDVGFEAKGEKWLGITIPFVGDDPQQPVIDTGSMRAAIVRGLTGRCSRRAAYEHR